jgi:Predicted membrane protein
MLIQMTTIQSNPKSPLVSGAAKPNWKRNIGVVLLLLFIVCGISLRFVGLGEKDFWLDEAHSIRFLAPTDLAQLYGRAFTTAELESQLRPTFDINGFGKTCSNIRESTSDQAPLYFLIARGFCPFFEDELFALRLLAAAFSVLTTPLFYLWVRRFTGNRITALVGALVISVSPFLMVYSAEARGYTLWVLLLILANHLCWQMDRLSGWKASLKYGCVLSTLAMNHLASVLFVPGHVAFMLYQGVKKRVILNSLIPLVVTLAIWNAYQGKLGLAFTRITSTSWMAQQQPIEAWWTRLVSIPARAFYDSGGVPSVDGGGFSPVYLLALIPIGIFIAGFFVKTSVKHRVFLLALLSYPFILIVMDLALGGCRAVVPRYQAPTLVVLLLETALIIGALLASISKVKRLLGGLLLASIVVAGLGSEILISQKHKIWTKYHFVDLSQAKRLIRTREHPLIMASNAPAIILASKVLHCDNARFEVVAKTTKLSIPRNTDGIVILRGKNEKSLAHLVPKLKQICPDVSIVMEDK